MCENMKNQEENHEEKLSLMFFFPHVNDLYKKKKKKIFAPTRKRTSSLQDTVRMDAWYSLNVKSHVSMASQLKKSVATV